jgi:hypothetical protein
MDKLQKLINWIENNHGSLPASRLTGKEIEEIRAILWPGPTDKDLQADIDNLRGSIKKLHSLTSEQLGVTKYYVAALAYGALSALDRIIARIPKPSDDSEGYGPVNLNDEEPDDLSFLQKPEPAQTCKTCAHEKGNINCCSCKAPEGNIHWEPKPAPDFDNNRDTSGDWPEDFPGENGQYECICVKCGRHFVGHKRRVVCKVCFSKSDFDAIAREIETEAYEGEYETFYHTICAEILRKHFGKED